MNPLAFFSPQVGFIPTGVNGVANVSTYFIGKRVSGAYEGIGLGPGGRPAPVEVVQINLAEPQGDGTYLQRGTITLNVSDVVTATFANPANFPTNLNLILKEVAVCENGTSKRMMIIGSQTYAKAS